MKQNALTADVVIIGAGVIGACIAFELSKSGYKTLSVDKEPEAGHGSTSASCAIIRTYYSTLESCAIAYESWFYWMKWAEYLGLDASQPLIEYRNCGSMVMKTAHNGYLEKICAMMQELDCPFEHVETQDIPQFLPGACLDSFYPAKKLSDDRFGTPNGTQIEGAVFFPCSGYVNDPKLAAINAQRAAVHHGAQFLFNAKVNQVLTHNSQVEGVQLEDGRSVLAPVVINVAGPHSSVINALAGALNDMKLTTRALRHEVAHVPAPQGFNGQSILSDSDIQTYMRPDGMNMLIGSEDPECDEHEWVSDPDQYNTQFSQQWNTLVMRLAQRLPALTLPNQARGVVSLYDVTEDWAPIYDGSSVGGFFMACGTSGNQFKNAPVAAKIMTRLVEAHLNDPTTDHDNHPLSLSLEHTHRSISLAAFSRKRSINPDSSFSVLG